MATTTTTRTTQFEVLLTDSYALHRTTRFGAIEASNVPTELERFSTGLLLLDLPASAAAQGRGYLAELLDVAAKLLREGPDAEVGDEI
jgi:hypothetical protein